MLLYPSPSPLSPSFVPTMETCTYVDETTSRRCRMPVSLGRALCGAHSPSSVACPECTTPVPASSLQRHLSKPLCPVIKQQFQTQNSQYYLHNANLIHDTTSTPQVQPDFIALAQLLSRLQPPEPSSSSSTKPLPENDHIRTMWADQRDNTLKMQLKHFKQISTLSTILSTPPPKKVTNIIELAAGRGYTSLYLAHLLNLRQIPCTITMVDRAATRHKADRTLRKWLKQQDHTLQSFNRIRIDLQHLNLSSIPNLLNPESDIRIVAKHACGQALDFALTASTRLATACKGNVMLVLASCCRNRCSYQAFGDSGRIWRLWGVSELLFAQICKAALWGLDENHDKEKAAIGRRCRLLIDHARVEWLNNVGWHAYVTTYTDASPENACIVAVWKGIPENMGQDNNTKLTSTARQTN